MANRYPESPAATVAVMATANVVVPGPAGVTSGGCARVSTRPADPLKTTAPPVTLAGSESGDNAPRRLKQFSLAEVTVVDTTAVGVVTPPDLIVVDGAGGLAAINSARVKLSQPSYCCSKAIVPVKVNRMDPTGHAGPVGATSVLPRFARAPVRNTQSASTPAVQSSSGPASV